MGKISDTLKAMVRESAKNRCGYCLSPQAFIPFPLEIDHLTPQAKGGSDEESNLWLACSACNNFKSDKTEAKDPETNDIVPLFNPRKQNWFEHFQWSEDSLRISGISPVGRATVSLLHLHDYEYLIEARKAWKRAGWTAPKSQTFLPRTNVW
jgi:hypothetical protein